MKIIKQDNIRIIIKDRNEYTIKTPIGVFKDINDAINTYPNLAGNKRIRQCKNCGTYFLLYNKGDNPRKYCSDKCSKKGNIIRTTENYYNTVFVDPNPYKPDMYSQQIKDTHARQKGIPEYHQDDTYWGLGTGNLTEQPANNFTHEYKYIQNELRRLKIK